MPSSSARRPADPIFTAEAVSVQLDGTPVLRDVAFALPRRAWIGVLGPNGSGKTTLLRTLRGLLPHRGRVAFDGRALTAWKTRGLARRIAFVQQQPTLAFDFTVHELVRLGRAPHKHWLAPYAAADRSIVREAMAATEVDALAERSVLSLSGGELRRVLLAQALAQQADTLLLDEPTTHLDVHHQYTLLDRLRRLVRDGRTVVVVFHDLELAARYADWLLVLDDGTLVADGPPDQILTTRLIEDVFLMEAEIRPGPSGPSITYRAPRLQ